MRNSSHNLRRPTFKVSQLWLCGILALAGAGLPIHSAHALNLLQAYESAIAKDARLAAARATAAAAEERLPQAKAQLLPNISFSGSEAQNLLDTTRPLPAGGTFTSTDRYTSSSAVLNLRQTIFRRQQSLSVDQAGFFVEDARYMLNFEVQNAGVRLSAAYFDALLANDQLRLIEAEKSSTTTQLDAARKALVAGSGMRTDVDTAQTRLDTVLAQEIEARQNVDFTRRQLQTLIGRQPGMLAGLDPSRIQPEAELQANLDDLIAQASENSPEIRSLKARVEASRLELDKASAGHYPTLDLVGQVSKSQSENITNPFASYFSRSIGVQLNVPIYSGGNVSSLERQALAQYQGAQAQLDAGLLEMSLKVQREFRGVNEGAAKIRALGQAARSANVALDSTNKSFKAGMRSILNVLDADQELKSSERNLIQARYNYIMSRIRLGALLGNANAVIEEVSGWLAAKP